MELYVLYLIIAVVLSLLYYKFTKWFVTRSDKELRDEHARKIGISPKQLKKTSEKLWTPLGNLNRGTFQKRIPLGYNRWGNKWNTK